MSRTKRLAITLTIVAAGSLGLVGVANASDYSHHQVDVAGLNVGGLVHGVLHLVGDVL